MSQTFTPPLDPAATPSLLPFRLGTSCWSLLNSPQLGDGPNESQLRMARVAPGGGQDEAPYRRKPLAGKARWGWMNLAGAGATGGAGTTGGSSSASASASDCVSSVVHRG